MSYKAVDRKVHPQMTGMHNERKIEAGRRLLPVHTIFPRTDLSLHQGQ